MTTREDLAAAADLIARARDAAEEAADIIGGLDDYETLASAARGIWGQANTLRERIGKAMEASNG